MVQGPIVFQGIIIIIIIDFKHIVEVPVIVIIIECIGMYNQILVSILKDIVNHNLPVSGHACCSVHLRNMNMYSYSFDIPWYRV